MAEEKIKFETPEAYIATFPAPVREILEQVRNCVKQAVPDAEEVISYNIPAFKRQGGWVLYYSAYKNHYSLAFPPPFTVFEVFKNELAPYGVSKSAVKLPLDQPVPVKLIAEMAKFRVEEHRASGGKKKK